MARVAIGRVWTVLIPGGGDVSNGMQRWKPSVNVEPATQEEIAAFMLGVAERVRRLRERRGWSVEELARRAGLPVLAVQMFESAGAEGTPDIDQLHRVATALTLNVGDLIPGLPL
jgi:ribosome-binding protein aMBF1 (putative translation factor)